MSGRQHIPEGTKLLVYAKTFGACWYCGRVIERKAKTYLAKGHIEHLVPLARGGNDSVGNLVPACLECNLGKGDKLPEEFRPVLHAQRIEWIADALDWLEGRFEAGPLEEEMAATLRCWQAHHTRLRTVFFGESRQAVPPIDYVI